MDKATPTPSPASVDSVMALADAYSLEAHRDGWKRDNGRSLNHHTAESRLRAEVERLAQAAPTDYYTACEQQNIALLSAMGYPHEKDSLVSPEEYAADLKRKADLFDVAAQAVRMLTREELNDVALSEQVGWGPGEYVEAVQRKFAEVNGLRIPADGKIGSAA